MNYEAMIVMSLLALAGSGFLYGCKFLRLHNPLLGIEWAILGASATSGAIYFCGGSEAFLDFTMYCDAFSRTVGIPLIATLGIMQVTHGLRLSGIAKVALFILGAALAAVLIAFQTLYAYLPVLGLVLGLAFSWVMLHMAGQLFRLGRLGHSVLMLATFFAFLVVSLADGIIEVPNPDKLVLLDFWFYSNIVWALGFAEIYFAYRAIESARRARTSRFGEEQKVTAS